MVRTFMWPLLLVIGLVSTATTAFSQTPATPENAASFVGDWTVSAETQFAVTVKVDAGKLVGSIAMGSQGVQPIKDFSLNGKTLALTYYFDYQGMPIETVVRLTPSGDKFTTEIIFASGAYTMSGTAEKKK